MSKTLERLTFFALGALVCSLGYLIGASENPTDANSQLPTHATFKSITLADDEINYTLTPRSIAISDANGHIEVGHGSYFPMPVKTNWRDFVLSGAIYEQMDAAVVDNEGVNVKYEAGDVKIIRYKD